MKTTIRNRKHSGTYDGMVGCDPMFELSGFTSCDRCGRTTRDVIHLTTPHAPDVQLCEVCAEQDPDVQTWTEAPVDEAARKLAALDRLTDDIHGQEELLADMYRERLALIRDAIQLDGLTAAEVAGRIGLTRGRLSQMLNRDKPRSTEAKGQTTIEDAGA